MNKISIENSFYDSDREPNFLIPTTEQFANIFQKRDSQSDNDKLFMSFRTSPKSPKKSQKILFDEKNDKYMIPHFSHIFKKPTKIPKTTIEEKLQMVPIEQGMDIEKISRLGQQNGQSYSIGNYEEYSSNIIFTKKGETPREVNF